MDERMKRLEAIEQRHSVRSYTDEAIQGEVLDQLNTVIAQCNAESGLHIQLCLNDDKTFSGMMAKFGKFNNVKNYIALVGKEDAQLEEKSGYYGEKIVIKAQELGLNTCWVALTYSKKSSKRNIQIHPGEKLLMVITIGYGVTIGGSHKMKTLEQLSNIESLNSVPEWFLKGLKAARLAPTAMNQQKFKLELLGDGEVRARAMKGPYSNTDLGIVKYHFEVGAGKENFEWVD